MGAFWNPNGGLIVGGRKLSKDEVAALKRKWSGKPQIPFSSLKGWWSRITFAVRAIFG